MFRHKHNILPIDRGKAVKMRPDFKEKAPAKRNIRRSSAVKLRSGPSPFSRISALITSLWQSQWHLLSAGLLIMSLSIISVWALNNDATALSPIAEQSLSPVDLSQQPIIKVDSGNETTPQDNIHQQGIRRNKWVSLPLALPPSEEEKFKEVLKSHNLVQRSAPSQQVVSETAIQPKTEQVPEHISEQLTSNNWQEWTVRSGDNLALMAKRNGVKAAEIHYLMKSGTAAKALKRIYPKQTIRVQTSDQGEILQLEYDIKATERLVVSRKDTIGTEESPFESSILDRPYEVQTAFAQGIIEDSLFLAGTRAGISDRLTMELSAIFGWDIDFVQDIRQGDRFSLLFEERYRDGERVKGRDSEGAILAAEFINNGRKIRAVRYTLPDGRTDYFTPDGKSLRKAFIRNPVDFARISSKFNLKRRHPILNKIRAHKGVDYAAPTGTPIRSAGDGKVVFRGKKGGYGNVIIIQHCQRYSTLYAHMSKYAKGSNNGRRVRQGQIIGYIGMSGLATGPHLHYEFRVNGVHRNPLTIKHPSVKPIAKDQLADFKSATAEIIAQLDLVGQAQYALLTK